MLEEEGPGGDRERIGKFSRILKDQITIMQSKVDSILKHGAAMHDIESPTHSTTRSPRESGDGNSRRSE